ncbi:MAG: rod shape-determining protein RodA [Bacteroidota bacterium]|jgi:rod shape determining protein RodA
MPATRNRKTLNPKLDFTSVLLFTLLVFFGFLNIYSASSGGQTGLSMQMNQVYTKQVIWMAGAFLLIILVTFSNPNFFEFTGYFFYGITVLLCIAVLLVGREVSGAKSWFGFAGVGIQPSEFAKFGTALALAKFLGTYGVRFKGWKNICISLAIFLVPMAIVLKQNDTGSALVFLSFFLVLYREGLPGYVLLAAVWLLVLAVLSIVLLAYQLSLVYWILLPLSGIALIFLFLFRKSRFWMALTIGLVLASWGFTKVVSFTYKNVLYDYQRDRIEIILGLKKDDKGVGFNLIQSKIAIGAGRWTGRGFLEGTQTKMGFVPEQHTDFIFCTIGEEWGFIGVLLFLTVYFGLLFRLVLLSERQTTNFARVLGYSVTSILFFHLCINIGMTIGLVPIIGIPLPFVSFGGSSLWAFTLLLFTFLKLDERRLSYA